MIWIACAAVVSFIIIYLFRLTGVSWFWSGIGGAVTAAVYSGLYLLLIWLLEFLIKGWLFG